MASLVKQTQRWVENGLISQEQASNLIKYEQNRFSWFSVTNVFLFLGVFAIGCGVCALIAANWQDIPDAVKLNGIYLLMAGLVVAAERMQKTNSAAFEAILFFYMLMLFAAIGLNGQVFHLVSDSWKAFMFWSFLAFPLLFLTKKVPFGYAWGVIFLCSLSFSPYMRRIMEAFEPFGSAAPWFFSFLCYAVFLTLHPVRDKKPVFLKPLCLAALYGALVPLVLPLSDFRYGMSELWTTAFVCVYGAAFAFGVRKMMPFNQKTKNILTGSIVLYILEIFIFSDRLFAKSGFLTFAFQFTQILLILGFAYCIKERRMFNVISYVAAATILFRFLDLFGTLMQTGTGLIVTGAVLIFAAKSWMAFMKKIAVRFNEEKAL